MYGLKAIRKELSRPQSRIECYQTLSDCYENHNRHGYVFEHMF